MTQLSKDPIDFGEQPLLPLPKAWELISEKIPTPTKVQTVSLQQSLGRITASEIVAPISLPSFNNSAVDGVAVSYAKINQQQQTILPLDDTFLAGEHPKQSMSNAIRVSTGSIVPAPFDTVYMEEDITISDGNVILPSGLPKGSNYRFSGEDIKKGCQAVAKGKIITPADIGFLAALGIEEISVFTQKKIAIFSIGNELQQADDKLMPAKIHDSNRPMLSAWLQAQGWHVNDAGIIPDDENKIAQALEELSLKNDAIILSGGMSKGLPDYTTKALSKVGNIWFWRLAMKPARPLGLGYVNGNDPIPVFCCPGNPAAALVACMIVGRAFISAIDGRVFTPPSPYQVLSGFNHKKKPGRFEFIRLKIIQKSGKSIALPAGTAGAGILSSFSRAEALSYFMPEQTVINEGDLIAVLPISSLTTS